MTLVDDDLLEQVSTVVTQVFDEQAPIEVVRGLAEDAAGIDEGLWKTLGELGFLGLELGDADGDGALGFAGLAIVLREAGRTLAPIPLLSSVVLGAGILRVAGAPSQRGDWLAGIGSGERRLAVGLGRGVVRDGEVLVGTLGGVLDGGTADAIVVEVSGPDGPELWLVPRGTAGLVTEAQATYDQTRRLTEVHLAGVRTRDAEPLVAHDPGAVIAWSIDRAATALAIDSAAGGRAAMELAVAYAKERQQFGRPIGSFQAVKHHCANMLVGVETSRVAAAAARASCRPSRACRRVGRRSRRPMPPMPTRRSPDWRSTSTGGSGSPGSTTCTCTSSGPSSTRRSSAPPRGIVSRPPDTCSMGGPPMGDLRVELTDHIATVTLDRPPVNAIDTATLEEIRSTFTALGEDRDVRVAIFTAAGEKAFMAGVDLKTVGSRPASEDSPATRVTDPAKVARDAMWAITDCAVPVIGAINGPALGAGLAFAACCDILIASERARFGTTEINVGLLGASSHLSLLVGRHKAREMFFTGEQVPAAELYRLGAVRAVVPPQDLMSTAMQLAGELASKSPIALRLAKESMNRVEGVPLKDAYRTEQDYTARLQGFDDAAEARQAYLERREPDFKWR